MSGTMIPSDDPTAQDSYVRALALSVLLNKKEPQQQHEKQQNTKENNNKEKEEEESKEKNLAFVNDVMMRLIDMNLKEFSKDYKIHSQGHKKRVSVIYYFLFLIFPFFHFPSLFISFFLFFVYLCFFFIFIFCCFFVFFYFLCFLGKTMADFEFVVWKISWTRKGKRIGGQILAHIGTSESSLG